MLSVALSSRSSSGSTNIAASPHSSRRLEMSPRTSAHPDMAASSTPSPNGSYRAGAAYTVARASQDARSVKDNRPSDVTPGPSKEAACASPASTSGHSSDGDAAVSAATFLASSQI